MKTVLLFLFSLFCFHFSFSQNLVPNGSFEQYSGCPVCEGELYRAVPWFNSATIASPDYYNACAFGCPYPVGVPSNWIGYQNARTGFAYAGVAVGSIYWGTGREYVAVKLLDSLQAGIKYYISFYVSLSDSARYATDDIGMYITKDSVSYIWDTLPYIPKINNPSGNILTDKNNWIQISGEIIAQGGEKYIYIGNFKGFANTTVVSVPNGGDSSYANNNIVYYYIDDVCLSQSPDTCGILLSITNNFLKHNFLVYPNPVKNIINIKTGVDTQTIIEIYDILGNKIYQNEITKECSINLSSQLDGVYFLHLIQDDKATVQKIIIAK